MEQGIRIHRPMQETRVQSLIWEDPICHRSTKPPTTEPARWNPGAATTEPARWSPGTVTTEPARWSPGAATTEPAFWSLEPKLLESIAAEPVHPGKRSL